MTFKSNNRCRNSENKTKTETLAAAMNVKRVIIRNVIRKHFTRKITLRSNSLKSFESRQNKFLKKKDYSHLFQFFLQVMNQPDTRELEKSKQNGKRWELSRKIFLEVKLLNDNNSPVGVFWPKKSRPTFSVRCLVENQRRWKNYPWPGRIAEWITEQILPVVQSIVSDQSTLKLNLKGNTLSLKTNEKKLVH